MEVVNKEISKWERPWDTEKFDDLYNRDERFFALLIKGVLGWLTSNISMYKKPIKHFIFNTGSSYMYVESNGYSFSWSETSGEDSIYMQMPRCVVVPGDINVPMEDLSNPYVRAVYERKDGTEMKGYNAEMRRIPVEMSMSLTYVLSNYNESLILIQELIDKLLFQKFFQIVYLGQTIECSLEVPQNFHIEQNKIDFAGTDVVQKTIGIELKICSNYPVLNERTEASNAKILEVSKFETTLQKNKINTEQINRTYN